MRVNNTTFLKTNLTGQAIWNFLKIQYIDFVLTQSEKLSNTNIVHAGPWLLRVGEHPPGSAISSFSRRSIAKVLGQNICRILVAKGSTAKRDI
jgi:hypothetical protein